MNTIKDNPTLYSLVDAVIDISSDEIDLVKRRIKADRFDALDEIKERVAQRTREVATAAYQAGLIDGQIKNFRETAKVLQLITTNDGRTEGDNEDD
jgi:hypothetical protein